MPTDHLILLFAACNVLCLFAYFWGVDHGKKSVREKLVDHDARETAETALAAIARLREDISALRAETLRDRDELRSESTKHERAIVRMGGDVKDAVDRCMAEATKLTMAIGQSTQRRVG